MPRLKATALLLSLATACVPATIVAQSTYGAVPGSINFIQGQANIDGQPIQANTDAAGKLRQLHAGETLATAKGSADILMAPGALLRIGDDSTVRLVAGDGDRTEVRLEQGRANVSVNVVRDHDLLLVDTQNGQTQVLSRGLYSFNAATDTMRVFNGEADVFPGADTTADVKPVKVKENHELILGGDRAKPASFDREMAEGDLLPWTGPKESQAALANAAMSNRGESSNGGGYSNAGYYPGAYGFYGNYPYYAVGYPYGWGYPYGPYGFGGYPFFGVGFGYYGGGFYGGYTHPIVPVRGPHGGYLGGGYGLRGGGYGGGHTFAGGARGFSGGGFHGSGGFSGGGFHGGGGRR